MEQVDVGLWRACYAHSLAGPSRRSRPVYLLCLWGTFDRTFWPGSHLAMKVYWCFAAMSGYAWLNETNKRIIGVLAAASGGGLFFGVVAGVDLPSSKG